ncbi:mpv17-like protein 2 [Macrotis lagotis]|uniref:mpv17-like protein 2 n=1 Tax=Macrotis lagotis TaxID=92651 RepID=UPI003D68FCCD
MPPPRARAVAGLLAAWRPLFRARLLLLTNTLGCGGLMAAGHGVCQAWERQEEERAPGRPQPPPPLDLCPTAGMFAVGCSMGPFLHYWCQCLWPLCAHPLPNDVCKQHDFGLGYLPVLPQAPGLPPWPQGPCLLHRLKLP